MAAPPQLPPWTLREPWGAFALVSKLCLKFALCPLLALVLTIQSVTQNLAWTRVPRSHGMELATATDAEPEIVTIILSYLNLRELHNAASVCQLWRSAVPGAYRQWQSAAHWEIAWSSSVGGHRRPALQGHRRPTLEIGLGVQVALECTELCAMRKEDSLPQVVMPDAQCARLMRMLVAAMTAGSAMVEAAKVEPPRLRQPRGGASTRAASTLAAKVLLTSSTLAARGASDFQSVRAQIWTVLLQQIQP